MQQGTKVFTVDKFLGLNEAADGYTELKMGQASRMVNWSVTDGMNITTRPGVQRLDFLAKRDPAPILAMWAGYIDDMEYLVVADLDGGVDRLWIYRNIDGGHELIASQEGALGLTEAENAMVKIFPFGGKVYVMSSGKTVVYREGSFVEAAAYVPLVIAGADPSGGGTTLENINLLSADRRIDYSPDGAQTAFWLPQEAVGVKRILVDGEEKDILEAGNFDYFEHAYTFKEAPPKGIGNVEITYTTDLETAERERLKIVRMPLAEAYNGSTDTRLFVAGDGSNICYYTGLPQSGEATALYFPAMNEVAVDMSDSPVTGLVRHYSKLLVFKPDGTFTITYEPVTLADGKTTAGFFLRPANREFGSDVLGQVQTVDNYPRTVTRGGIYEWRITSSYYQDERYAKRVSDKVERTLQSADISAIRTCDDSTGKTYYIFLNDSEGTVLVSRYALGKEDIWSVYKGRRFRDVRFTALFCGRMVFAGEKEIFYLDEDLATDAPETAGGTPEQIEAVWETGFMDFGSDFRRKYSSTVYISLQPQSNSALTVTAETDRRSEYTEKVLQANVFSWPNQNFVSWTFDVNDTPKIRRLRLKVKKFVYYKLIFRAGGGGSKATVLGYDQQVRFGSMAK